MSMLYSQTVASTLTDTSHIFNAVLNTTLTSKICQLCFLYQGIFIVITVVHSTCTLLEVSKT